MNTKMPVATQLKVGKHYVYDGNVVEVVGWGDGYVQYRDPNFVFCRETTVRDFLKNAKRAV